ncbi:hypothetical protein BH20ACT6_BH20ACT6_11980 [soil metagenome]
MPHSLLVLTWRAPHLGLLTTRVRVELTATTTGTAMVIEHSGLPDVQTRDAHAHGWASIAAKLAAYARA